MGTMVIRDDAVWLKHIESDQRLVKRIEAMASDEPLDLVVDGTPIRFRRMKDGRDGRPTLGLRPDPTGRAIWAKFQARRGERVTITLIEAQNEAYLTSLTPLASEWTSPEDDRAYNDL
jgi:hypothetical protein